MKTHQSILTTLQQSEPMPVLPIILILVIASAVLFVLFQIKKSAKKQRTKHPKKIKKEQKPEVSEFEIKNFNIFPACFFLFFVGKIIEFIVFNTLWFEAADGSGFWDSHEEVLDYQIAIGGLICFLLFIAMFGVIFKERFSSFLVVISTFLTLIQAIILSLTYFRSFHEIQVGFLIYSVLCFVLFIFSLRFIDVYKKKDAILRKKQDLTNLLK